jgi:FtsP/CotA-like multicopper oxidase with cupredoxin domain
VTVDAVLLGMGERYDVQLTAASGAWPIYALAEGKNAAAVAVLRTTDARVSAAPPVTVRPAELQRSVLGYAQLAPAAGQALATREPDRRFTVDLTGNMHMYQWGLGGNAKNLNVRPGERIRIAMRNRSGMWHPMHLHGHTFALTDHSGVRKDTVNVLPAQTATIDFDADNPGQWAYHCHNVYHQSLGMMTTLSYVQ